MVTPINMSEPVCAAEFTPPALASLQGGLKNAFGSSNVWTKGDQWHDYGYHRGRTWVYQSAYTRYGAQDYSVQGSKNQGGDPNWICAIDFAFPDDVLATIYERLVPALSAGLAPQVRELIQEPGHGHISFWRSMANNDHTKLLNIMTGEGEDSVNYVISTTDNHGNYVFVNPFTHTWCRIKKEPTGHTGTYWPLANKLSAYDIAGVVVKDGQQNGWIGGYDLSDPVNLEWIGIEVKVAVGAAPIPVGTVSGTFTGSVS